MYYFELVIWSTHTSSTLAQLHRRCAGNHFLSAIIFKKISTYFPCEVYLKVWAQDTVLTLCILITNVRRDALPKLTHKMTL